MCSQTWRLYAMLETCIRCRSVLFSNDTDNDIYMADG